MEDESFKSANESTESKNNSSMEALKVEQDEKDGSMEDDLFGAQSLLVSDSEGEEEKNDSKPRKESPEVVKPTIQSKFARNVSNELESVQEMEDIERPKKKFSRLISSESNEDSAEEQNPRDEELGAKPNKSLTQIGAQSLLMNDSESEKGKTVVSSISEEESPEVEQTVVQNEINELESVQEMEDIEWPKKKYSRFLSSDSEEETDEKKNHEGEKLVARPRKSRQIINSEDELEDSNMIGNQQSETSSLKEKMKSLIDSDSDNEDQIKKTDETSNVSKKSVKMKFSNLIDSDSEDENQKERSISPSVTKFDQTEKKKIKKEKGLHHESKKKKKDKKKKIKKEKSKTSKPSDSGPGESSQDENEKLQKNNLDSSETSSSSGDSESDLDEPELSPRKEIESDNINGTAKKIRPAAQKALDEMQKIQSEQQRLHREAHITIPYHVPKKHTLEEFLKRRTIMKPSQESGESTVSLKLPSKSLKMTSEELERYAQIMEERAREATEFFKSESEDENENELKDNDGIQDLPTYSKSISEENIDAIKCSGEQKDIVENSASVDVSENLHEQMEVDHETPLIETQPEDIAITSPKAPIPINTISPGKVLITEVLELPKLDLSKSHITVDDNLPSCSSPNISVHQEVNKISPKQNQTPSTTRIENQIKAFKALHHCTLNDSPTIKGDKDMIIDLDSGDLIPKKPSGIDNLLQRLMASKKAKKEKTSESVSILSVENGKLEMSKVNISLHEDSDPNKEHKPGEAYFKLKSNLKTLIQQERLKVLEQKKAEMNKAKTDEDNEEEFEDEESDGDDDDEMIEYELDSEGKKTNHKNKDIVVDEEENAFVLEEAEEEAIDEGEDDKDELDFASDSKKLKIKTESNEDEIDEDDEENEDDLEDEDDDEEDEDDDDDDSSDNEEDNNTANTNKKKNRILTAFQDDSDEEADINFLKTPNVETQKPPKTSLDQQPGQGILFDKEVNKSFAEQENELIDLCSGQFDITQAPPSLSNAPFISQIPITQAPKNEKLATEELLELCSGSFDQDIEAPSDLPAPTQLTTKGNKILSSDEELNDGLDDGEAENEHENLSPSKRRIKKLKKRLKKRRAKLGFSDDEDEQEFNEALESDENDQGNELEDEEDEEEDQPETFVEYDSEENEIVVQLTKKDRVMRASNFVENEAELSESEWGSADEDEKNMDKYDIELGDEDEFDRDQIRDELGKIHARKMLDEDVKAVRRLQEMFVEDEETDGVGRQRQFRWKNAESGFSLENDKKDENDPDGNGESGDEENEHLWRKIRFEREQILKEQLQKGNASATLLSSTLSTTEIKSPNITTLGVTKKINIITAKTKATTQEPKKSSPFLISKNITSLYKKTARGSFLVRDKDTLTKLAGLTKGGSAITNTEPDGTAGTVSVKTAHAKNFVFATLTEEEHENLKRKADDLINSSSENGINYMKKPKTEPRRDKCFIDQLL